MNLYRYAICICIFFIIFTIILVAIIIFPSKSDYIFQPNIMLLRDNLTLPNGSRYVNLDDPNASILANIILQEHVNNIERGIKNGSIKTNFTSIIV